MKRGWAICRAGYWNPATAADRVLLTSGGRQLRRMELQGRNGPFLLDLDEAVDVCNGDGIVLDDGSIVMISGLSEPLAEVAVRSPRELVRLAWQLGNHHADMQVVDGVLRIRRNPGLEEMIAACGATVTHVEAPFDPDGGTHVHRHEHDHEHGHDHHHGHHHGHGHDGGT